MKEKVSKIFKNLKEGRLSLEKAEQQVLDLFAISGSCEWCGTAKENHNGLCKTAVISRLSLWWIRTFKVISNQRAKEIGLRHWRNVYGDEINHLNCRSIWFDDKSRQYRVSHLEDVC